MGSKRQKAPFNILELIIAIVLVAGVVASALYAINPVERAKKDRDELYRENAKNLIEAISEYSAKTGKPYLALPWTPIQDPKSGLDLAIADSLVPSKIKSERFATSADPKEWIYTGHADKSDMLYACFIPESLYFRIDHIALSSLESGKALPEGGRPEFCPKDPDWQTSFCYSCVSQKLSTP